MSATANIPRLMNPPDGARDQMTISLWHVENCPFPRVAAMEALSLLLDELAPRSTILWSVDKMEAFAADSRRLGDVRFIPGRGVELNLHLECAQPDDHLKTTGDVYRLFSNAQGITPEVAFDAKNHGFIFMKDGVKIGAVWLTTG